MRNAYCWLRLGLDQHFGLAFERTGQVVDARDVQLDAAQRDQHARARAAAAGRAREQAAVHGHRLRAVFAQVHRAQPVVASATDAPGRDGCARAGGCAAHPSRRTSSHRHIAPWCGISAAISLTRRSCVGLLHRLRADQQRQHEVATTRRSPPCCRSRAAPGSTTAPAGEHQQRHQAADDHRVQRAQLIGAVVAGVVEEQRVIEAEAGGEDQRDQVEQVQFDARARAAPPGSAAWSAPSAQHAQHAARRAQRDPHRRRQQQRAPAPAPTARARGTAATSDSEACLRSSNWAPLRAAPRVRPRRDRRSPLKRHQRGGVAAARRSSRPSTLAASGVPARSRARQCGCAAGARRHRRGNRRRHRRGTGASASAASSAARKRRGVRQLCLPRALRRRAGQVARGQVVAGDRAVGDAGARSAGTQTFGCLQRGLGVACLQRDARSARPARRVRSRSCASRASASAGTGVSLRQVVLPERAGRERGHRDRDRGEHRPAPSAAAAAARSATTAAPARAESAASRGAGSISAGSTKRVASAAVAEAGDGEHRQLLQAVDAGHQEGHVGDAGRRPRRSPASATARARWPTATRRRAGG